MNVNSENRCPNCSAELNGPYCASCGQRQLDLDKPLREIASEAMDAFLSFDARILRTLRPLVVRPGFLTVEFLEGRRARYVHPFKLYFAISVLLFIGLALSGYSVIVVGGPRAGVVTIAAYEETEETGNNEVDVELAASGDSQGENGAMSEILAPLAELADSDPDRLNRMFTDRLAKSIFILVPLFALLLRCLYWRRTYISQLVFSLHLHSFAFLATLVGIGLDRALGAAHGQGPGNTGAILAIAVYSFLALRRVQGQGRLITVAKMVVLLFGYLVALIATMIFTVALTAVAI